MKNIEKKYVNLEKKENNSMEVKLCSGDGSIIKCDMCNQDAGFFIGAPEKNSYFCSDHNPFIKKDSPQASFVYMPSTDTTKADVISLNTDYSSYKLKDDGLGTVHHNLKNNKN